MEQSRIDMFLSRYKNLQCAFDRLKSFITDNLFTVLSDYLELQLQKNSKKKTKKYTSDANYEIYSEISIKLLRCNTVNESASLCITSDLAYGTIEDKLSCTFCFRNPDSLKISVVGETKGQNHHYADLGLVDLLRGLDEMPTSLDYILFRYLRQTNEEDVLMEIRLRLDEKLISLTNYQSILTAKLRDVQIADITTMIKIARNEPIDLSASEDSVSISNYEPNKVPIHGRKRSRLQEDFDSKTFPNN